MAHGASEPWITCLQKHYCTAPSDDLRRKFDHPRMLPESQDPVSTTRSLLAV